MLRLLNIRYFQDVLDLEPFERWERRLYEEIGKCDLFLLFWSTPARDSKWVMEELHYALDHKHENAAALPHIRPVVVEGPPVPEPPKDLKKFHFNDFMIYFIAATQLEKSRRRGRVQDAGR